MRGERCGKVEERGSEEDRSRFTMEWGSDLMVSILQTKEACWREAWWWKAWRWEAERSGIDSGRKMTDSNAGRCSVDEMWDLEWLGPSRDLRGLKGGSGDKGCREELNISMDITIFNKLQRERERDFEACDEDGARVM